MRHRRQASPELIDSGVATPLPEHYDDLKSSSSSDSSFSFQSLIIHFLKSIGPIPSHIAFIMDGNRRYARQQHFSHIIEGHQKGFEALERILQCSLDLGIKALTVYAFSIDNFKRSEEEVEGLMTLAVSKFETLARNENLIRKHRVKIQILGDLSLLGEEVRRAAENAMAMTAHHEGRYLNICFAYTGRHEMEQAVERSLLQLENETNLSQALATFENHLFTATTPYPVSLLVRTSGAPRLSDFLLWQCTQRACAILFLDTLWPAVTLYDLIWPLLLWKWSVFWGYVDKE